MNYSPLLLIDFYKSIPSHPAQYPKDISKIVSYFTPRGSRISGVSKIPVFGLQAFIKTYLIDMFNKEFFYKPLEEVISDYLRIMKNSLLDNKFVFESVAPEVEDRISEVHKLGYLPLEIRSIPEGSLVDLKVPIYEISNTLPKFAWLVNTIETAMSSSNWHSIISAWVGIEYRKIANDFYKRTVDDNISAAYAIGDFSMRGQSSIETAVKASSAFLCSFLSTATVPAIMYLEKNYNCNSETETVAKGTISWEHSTVTANFAVDGDEITSIRRALTEIYPHSNFSYVSDSYDYWNVVTNILPELKQEILTHQGFFGVRGDSGDPVEIVAGKRTVVLDDSTYESLDSHECIWSTQMLNNILSELELKEHEEIIFTKKDLKENFVLNCGMVNHEVELFQQFDGKYFINGDYWIGFDIRRATPQDKGTVWCLWEEFGGDINSKGYKVVNEKIKTIYGDAITHKRAKEIYNRLFEKGFAANNVFLGAGSFSFHCLETEEGLSPYTRDTFSIAVKATYAEKEDGTPLMLFKDPITDKGKQSQKGCCIVSKDNDENYSYTDGHLFEQTREINELKQVFINSVMTSETSLAEIRKNLWGSNFN